MCGICGVIRLDGSSPVNENVLRDMIGAQRHRGPDQEGVLSVPGVGLGFCRLAIIDLSPAGHQPMRNEDGTVWLVFNGEIYNFRELRAELTALCPDYHWKTNCDTEALLAAYAQWGDKCVEHLNGMFAFAIWDGPARALFLARDRMGQKPLYYAIPYSASALPAIAFASELSALGALPWFADEIDEASLREYLRWGYIGGESTIYRLSRKVAPAMWQRCTAGKQGGAYYFSPNDAAPEARNPGTARARVITAVRRQLISDVPIGFFLSGGIDSSVIAAAARQALGPDAPLFTFSIGFDDPRYDERAPARRVAAHLGTTHREFLVKPDAAADLPRLAEVFGEPFADSSALPTHYLARETRAHVKVALSGDGGDELFGGYERYRAMRLENRLLRLPASLRRVLADKWAARLGGAHPKSRAAKLRRFLQSIDQSPGRRYASYLRLFDDAALSRLLRTPFEPAPDPIAGEYESLLKSLDFVQAALATDRVSYLPDDLLTKVDRAAMLHALEVRSPFMDHELVRFAAGLTTDQLLRAGPKRLLREAFANDLPAGVFRRRKMGFAIPIGDWFRGTLRPMLRDHLFAADSFASQYFDKREIERLIESHESSREDHSQRLFALLMLEVWRSTLTK